MLESGNIEPGWFVALDCYICLLHSIHIDYYLVAYSDLVSVGGIGFDPLPAPFIFASLLLGVWHRLCPSRVMPWYRVFQTPVAVVMLRYRVDIFSAIHPYCFGDRHVSIPNRALHLAPLATLTDLCYQKRAMAAALLFLP